LGGKKRDLKKKTQSSLEPMASYDSYLNGVKVNKNIFKLFQEKKTRCHALSSWDGIYDEIYQHAIIDNHSKLKEARWPHS